jgi:hypothetical protein
MPRRPQLAASARLLEAMVTCGLLCGFSQTMSAVPVARLEGAVTYRGRPVENGGVTFGPQEAGHGQSIWPRLSHGRYVAPAVPIDKVRVQINVVEEQGSYIAGSVFGRLNVAMQRPPPKMEAIGVFKFCIDNRWRFTDSQRR